LGGGQMTQEDQGRLVSVNPATGETVGEVEVTPIGEIPSAVERARAAQASWAALDVQERAQCVLRAEEGLQRRVDALARWTSEEMGKPYRNAKGEASFAANHLRSLVEEVVQALKEDSMERGGIRSTVVRDPMGVAVCISPWNFPVLMPHQQLIPALVAGNAVLFKPSEETPLTGACYAEALQEVLPEGLLQVVHGDERQGKALVASSVDLIVFTGSREAGKDILGVASRDLKRVILELGGKDPLLVLESADLEKAARFAVKNSFRNTGQVCVSTERIYVHEKVHDEFLARLCDGASQLTVGDPQCEETDLGPMVHEHQKSQVLAQVEEALREGARVAWQGPPAEGSFLSPIVMDRVRHDMGIAQHETFGPVACVVSVTSDEQALHFANDTRFGLGAVVFGGATEAREMGRRLQAGMVGVNQGLASAGSTPWVGARESGYGFHSGPEGHRQFTQVRVIHESLDV
jgi:acyl-CoA reductase-like NAD-dependent aldehyde dehydrogenase